MPKADSRSFLFSGTILLEAQLATESLKKKKKEIERKKEKTGISFNFSSCFPLHVTFDLDSCLPKE